MSEKYIQKNDPNLVREVGICRDILESMRQSGLKDLAITNVDFNFTSDDKEELKGLQADLAAEFKFKVDYLKSIATIRREYELSIEMQGVIISDDLLIFLIGYLFTKALNHNCCFGDWGASVSDKIYDLKVATKDALQDKGYEYYHGQRFYLAYQSFYLANLKKATAELEFNLGCLKYDYGFRGDATDHFTNAITIDPKNLTPYLNRGVAYYDMQEYEKAISDYQMATRDEPKNPSPYINLGNAYIKLGNKDLAIQNYDKAIALGAEDGPKIKAHGLSQIQL